MAEHVSLASGELFRFSCAFVQRIDASWQGFFAKNVPFKVLNIVLALAALATSGLGELPACSMLEFL